MADVKLDIIGDADKAEEELKKLQTRLDRVEQKSKQTGRTSQQANRKQQQSLRGTIGTVAKLAAGYVGVQAAIRGVIQENERLSRGVDELLQKLPTSELKLRLQAGIAREEFEEQLPQLQQILRRTPAVKDTKTGLAIQRQLISSGFRQEDVRSGAALRQVLRFRAGTGAFDQGPEQSVQAVQGIASFLKSQGIREPSAEQIGTTAGRVAGLFRRTDLQPQDLSKLAEEASPVAQLGIDRETQLAAFSVLRGSFQAPRAARGLRLATTRLSSAAASTEKTEQLARIGLKPEDIDLVGETLPEALTKLKGALADARPEVANVVRTKLFGEQGQAFAQTLLDAVPTIRERVGLQAESEEGFRANVRRFRESRVARQQGAELATEFQQRAVDVQRGRLTFQELRSFVDQARAREARERGGRLGEGAAADFAALSFEISAGEKAGRTPREVAERIQSGFLGTGLTGPAADELTEVLRENNIRLQENTEEQKRANRNRPPLNRNGNAE